MPSAFMNSVMNSSLPADSMDFKFANHSISGLRDLFIFSKSLFEVLLQLIELRDNAAEDLFPTTSP